MSSEKDRKGWRYLYQCDECNEKRFVSSQEANRSAKPKCMKCGCSRLELVSEVARKDMQRLQRERIVGTGGSLHLASSASKRRRKVR